MENENEKELDFPENGKRKMENGKSNLKFIFIKLVYFHERNNIFFSRDDYVLKFCSSYFFLFILNTFALHCSVY